MKKILERYTPLSVLLRYKRDRKAKRKFLEWKIKGSELPMPHYGKKTILLEYIERFRPKVLIETGTYKGQMVYSLINKFDEIFSIELDRALFEKAQRKFRWYNHVHIIHGQSGEKLPGILEHLTQPCLFWLDAHWSGGSTAKGDIETPIIQELQSILNHREAEKHILLIDDARLFVGANDYPTLQGLRDFILNMRPGWVFEVKDDIIRVHSGKLRTGDI